MAQSTQTLKAQPRKVITDDIEEIKSRLNDLIDAFIFQSSSISIESNFNGYVAKDVEIAPGESLNIQHFLGVIPKWRVILKQVGNGVITDVNEKWNTKFICLKNNGSEKVTISILIARE
jgi:hypothetical protein